jgi:hypothetical protein
LTTSIKQNKFSNIKHGQFLLGAPIEESDTLKCFSLSPEPLEDLQKFLGLVTKVSRPQLRLLFSPEEEVFEPYFPFVQLVYEGVDQDVRLRSQYERAFEEYQNRRFESCINALGLIAEDYLNQVYETLLRDVAPKGKKLGHLYDTLHSEIRSFYKKEPPQPADLNALYAEITDAFKVAGENNTEDVKRLLTMIRSMVGALKTERICNTHSLKDLQHKDNQISVFPLLIRNNLNELIRYRNAAAHKTRVPLGNYEALRTMYSLFAFVMWWLEELSLVNWRLERTDIIDAFIKKSE